MKVLNTLTSEVDFVLVVAPDFGGVGGVQRAARQLDLAVRAIASEVSVRSLTRSDREVGDNRNRLLFTVAAVKSAKAGEHDAVVVAAHPNLAPVAYLAARRMRCPYAVWAHGYEVWGRLKPTVRWALHRADAVWAGSAITAQQLETRHKIDPAKVRLLRYCFTPELKIPDGVARRANVVLTVSRLTQQNAYKGVDTLVLAWPHVRRVVPDAELVVAGEGDDRERLERLARRLGLAHSVRFLGSVDDTALAREYAEATVFALPGRAGFGRRPYGEGFGLVFLEAAAAGLPAIAGRAGGAPEAVLDGVTGRVVDPLDEEAVASAIAELLIDPALAQSMGDAGRERVAVDFDFEVFKRNVALQLQGLRS
jgi:phosphatidylinositol alpha-1,6-mannosyltransferase